MSARWPGWVPRPVIDAVESLSRPPPRHSGIMARDWLNRDHPEYEKRLLRLATDPRMKGVWRKLKKHKPCARTELEEDCASWFTPHTGLSDSDIAIKLTFLEAVSIATCENTVDTVAENAKQVNAYRSQAARLRAEAAQLRMLHYLGDELEEQAQAVDRVAAWCKEEADTLAARDPANPEDPMIKRDHGFRREIGYVDMLADWLAHLYGTPLPHGMMALIAVVTNVVFGRSDVTTAKVRDWVNEFVRIRARRRG
jgi:hypothetical protein